MELDNISNDFIKNGPMAKIIRAMKDNSLNHWGFAIYKAAEVTDEDHWTKYLDALKQDVHEELEHNGRDLLLEQYASWPSLDISNEGGIGANEDDKSAVRSNFQNWCNEQLQQHQQEPSNPNPDDAAASTVAQLKNIPRFRYCLYVDQKCLNTLAAHITAKAARKRPGLGRPPPALVAMVLDTTTEHWQYYNLRYVAGLYDELHKIPMAQSELYVKPPAIGPLGFESM